MNDAYPTITGVAVKYGEEIRTLPKPYRHHHVLHKLFEEKGNLHENKIQGFVDETGKFYDRLEAFCLVTKSGQIKRRQGPGTYQGDELFSEDLW